MISNMKLAGIITKALPWMVEGYGEKQMNVRYIGIKVAQDWQEICSEKNNLMVKFAIDRTSAYMDLYLANKPPFVRIMSSRFTNHDKWETILGECKRKLKKDKADITNHTEKIGNLYKPLLGYLK